MKAKDLTETQKTVLAHVAKRLRRQADQLDALIRSGKSKELRRAYGMLHATESQLLWAQNS